MSLSTTKAHLQAIRLHDMPPRYVGRLAAHEAMLLEIEGFPAPLLTPVRIACSDGSAVPGEIVGFRLAA